MSEPRSLSRELELEIEFSKLHWTETSGATSESDDEGELDEEERLSIRDAFEKLKEDPVWGLFFRRQPYDLEIGQKIAEGGQAEIFEAFGTNKHEYVYTGKRGEKTRLVLKVFKKGFLLQDLRQLWPSGLASAAIPYRYFPRATGVFDVPGNIPRSGLCFSVGAQLMPNGRFAFVFDQFWGDLHKLIDRPMRGREGRPLFSLTPERPSA